MNSEFGFNELSLQHLNEVVQMHKQLFRILI